MTFYIVTSGQYSDYHIDAVFIDKQKALQYCAANGICDDVCIEEWETHDEKINCKKPVNRKYVGYIENGRLRITSKPYTFDEQQFKFERYGLWFPSNPAMCPAKFACVFPVDMKLDRVERAIQDRFVKWVYDAIIGLDGENQ